MPGLGCNIPEMLVLGLFFLIGSLICICLLINHIRLRKVNKQRLPFSYTIIFFATISLWMAFRGVISIFPFNYTNFTFNIVFTNISAILFALPLSFIILILCNILFTYRNPGTRMIIFFKMLFFIFLIAFLVIAIVILYANANDQIELDREMRLWRSCTDLIICFFFGGVATQLINEFAIKSPNKKSNRKCLSISITGVAIFCLIFALRVIYNFLAYCNINPIEHIIQDEIEKSENTNQIPSATTRTLTVIYYFIFDFFATCLGIAAIIYIEKKELYVITKNDYEQHRSDSLVE